MELRQLVTFRTVAQTLSFSRAAASLNYAQSTVSAQIQILEEELGVSLFDRLGKSIVLTDAGERLLGYAEKLLDLAGEARAVVSEGDTLTGTLTISAPETLCAYRLPALLRRFRDRYPQVQLVFRPGYNTDLERSIREGVMDVAFVMDEALELPNLVIERLIREPLLLLANPGHPLTQVPAVNFTHLHDVPMILTERGCAYRSLFERALAAAGSRLVTPMEFHSVEAIKQCVMTGIGITLLPLVAVTIEIEQGRLVPLNWAGRDFEVITQMIWHKDKWLSPALQAFLDVAWEVLGQATPELITSQSESEPA